MSEQTVGAACPYADRARKGGAIPSEARLDRSLAFLREGFRFMPERRRRYGSDAFETRLMLRKAVCIGGEEAAKVFYTPDRFTRRGAVPPHTLRLVQGPGSVMTLDGEAHRRRKALFIEILNPEAVGRLGDLIETVWRERTREWAERRRVVLLRAAEEVLTEAAAAWAGLPLARAEVARRAWEFHAAVDGAGAFGPRAVRGLVLRKRAELWGRDLFATLRKGGFTPPPDSPVAKIAGWRDLDGSLLSPHDATQELFNLLRTTSAIARFVVFAALEMHRDPQLRAKVAAGEAAFLTAFADEVRRFYPFVPAMGGRVIAPFEWRGRRFERGAWVLMDLYGTDHDPQVWGDPEVFRPERFLERPPGLYDLIPQGGGRSEEGHRCPGDHVVAEGIKRTAALLARMRYDVPAQDLSVDLARIPPMPASGFVIRKVEALA